MASGQSSTASRWQLFDSEDSHNTGICCHTHFLHRCCLCGKSLTDGATSPVPHLHLSICMHKLMSSGCFGLHSYHCDSSWNCAKMILLRVSGASPSRPEGFDEATPITTTREKSKGRTEKSQDEIEALRTHPNLFLPARLPHLRLTTS